LFIFDDPLPRLWQTQGVDGRKSFRGIVSIHLPFENSAKWEKKRITDLFLGSLEVTPRTPQPPAVYFSRALTILGFSPFDFGFFFFPAHFERNSTT
jgi:hypothetical protein